MKRARLVPFLLGLTSVLRGSFPGEAVRHESGTASYSLIAEDENCLGNVVNNVDQDLIQNSATNVTDPLSISVGFVGNDIPSLVTVAGVDGGGQGGGGVPGSRGAIVGGVINSNVHAGGSGGSGTTVQSPVQAPVPTPVPTAVSTPVQTPVPAPEVSCIPCLHANISVLKPTQICTKAISS